MEENFDEQRTEDIDKHFIKDPISQGDSVLVKIAGNKRVSYFVA